MTTTASKPTRASLVEAQEALETVRAFERFVTTRIIEFVSAGLAVDRETGKPVTGYRHPQAAGWTSSFRARNLAVENDSLIIEKVGQDEFGPTIEQTFLLPLGLLFDE